MKKLIEKILCRMFGIHKVNEEDWMDSYNWDEEYLGQNNWCSRCGKMVTRDNEHLTEE